MKLKGQTEEQYSEFIPFYWAEGEIRRLLSEEILPGIKDISRMFFHLIPLS